MGELEKAGITLAAIRAIDMVGYLGRLGYSPSAIKKNGTDYWYLSPLRNESEASFHVNLLTNEWYDFPLATGGNLVDFCLRYHGCTVAELLDKFNMAGSVPSLPVHDAGLHEGRALPESKLVVTGMRELFAYPLKNYLHERAIPIAIAAAFCAEVSYRIGDQSYYGIGFKNDSGGYEIRNKNYKQSSSPKDITKLWYGADSVEVFEGFFDFLSYRAMQAELGIGDSNIVVLNGAGMFDKALPFLNEHETVRLWLDRDVTGKAYTQYALSLGSRYRDESGRYSDYKDLNEWLVHKTIGQKQVLRPGIGLRPPG